MVDYDVNSIPGASDLELERLEKRDERVQRIMAMSHSSELIPGVYSSLPSPRSAVEKIVSLAEENYASVFYEQLKQSIKNFDISLDAEHEVGIRIVSFGRDMQFHLTNIGYWDPSLIIFRGNTDDSEPVQLIQHVSQISILLMKVKADSPKHAIGFLGELAAEKVGDDGGRSPDT